MAPLKEHPTTQDPNETPEQEGVGPTPPASLAVSQGHIDLISQQPYDSRDTVPMRKQGGVAWYKPLTDDEITQAFAISTVTARSVLIGAAKGKEIRNIAEEVGCSVSTIDRYKAQSHIWRDAFYTLMARGRMPASPETLRQLAQADQMEHYEVLHGLATDTAVAPRDRSVAAKEALVLAGAYKADPPTGFDFEFELFSLRGRVRSDG